MQEGASHNQESPVDSPDGLFQKPAQLKLKRKEKLERKEQAHLQSHMRVDNNDILSIHSNNPEGDVIRKFYESQIKPKTEEEKRMEEEKEAERLKKL